MSFRRVTIGFCGRCEEDTVKIEAALAELSGVVQAYVSPSTEMAYVVYDPDLASVEVVSSVVREVGVELEEVTCLDT